MSLLQGKKGLVFGLANEKSIAWGISRRLFESGATLAFTYQGDVMEKRVKPLAQSLNADFILNCNVTDDNALTAVFETVEKRWGALDFIVHSVGFSDRNELKGRYCDTSLNNFLKTMHISCFSFTDICRRACNIATKGASFLTLSYYGAEKVLPNYNVMGVAKAALEASVRYLANDLGPAGIRVNALSSGPVKTLAASGISDLRLMLKTVEKNAPLRRNISTDDVGKSALYLLSDLSSGVTGQTLYVDNGYSILGMTTSPLQNGEE